MLDRYIAATGQDEAFERAYWALAAQRNTRILGVFTRLWKRDGKPGYRRFQPRMWGLLERDLSQPVLSPVRDWFDANIPPRRAARPGWKRPDARPAARFGSAPNRGRGPGHGDGHGGRPRQAHAAADRDPAQAVGRGQRQGR